MTSGYNGSVTTVEPATSAKSAGLRYITDDRPGIRRVKRGSSFRYVGLDGKPIRDESELSRIRKLAIPPAYAEVWISPDPRGHLQATGRDARGRKQYRYHPRWREVRDETKFDRMIAFAKALPSIRAAVARDLGKPGLPREKVLATVVSLLEATMIRVGNEEYAKQNDSYGLTTMHEEHVKISGDTVKFHFRGKSGREHTVSVKDRRLAKIVRRCRELPGQELFQYIDEHGERASISSHDVNDYLRSTADDDFTAKDFRTWEGTLGCALALATLRAESKTEAKAHVVAAIKAVAERLGNTPAVCKKSYIHPGVIDEFVENGALELVERRVRKAAAHDPHALDANETKVLAFIEKLITRDENEHLTDLLVKSVKKRAKRA
ncbi:MAG: DNA topoisomerase IB [Candidatus Velthaea sp.]